MSETFKEMKERHNQECAEMYVAELEELRVKFKADVETLRNKYRVIGLDDGFELVPMSEEERAKEISIVKNYFNSLTIDCSVEPSNEEKEKEPEEEISLVNRYYRDKLEEIKNRKR